MWLKKLFTVPEGEKITEKVFSRVLVSSICSILLCMSCLFGATWAWFVAEIENQNNIIQIAEVTINTEVTDSNGVAVTKEENGSYKLDAGIYKVKINVEKTAASKDDLGNTPTMYVVVTVSGTEYYIVSVPVGEEFSQEFQLDKPNMTVSFAPSWIKPDQVTQFSVLAPAEEKNDSASEEENSEENAEENQEQNEDQEDSSDEPGEDVNDVSVEEPSKAETTAPTETPTESSTESETEAPSVPETEESQDTSETP